MNEQETETELPGSSAEASTSDTSSTWWPEAELWRLLPDQHAMRYMYQLYCHLVHAPQTRPRQLESFVHSLYFAAKKGHRKSREELTLVYTRYIRDLMAS